MISGLEMSRKPADFAAGTSAPVAGIGRSIRFSSTGGVARFSGFFSAATGAGAFNSGLSACRTGSAAGFAEAAAAATGAIAGALLSFSTVSCTHSSGNKERMKSASVPPVAL